MLRSLWHWRARILRHAPAPTEYAALMRMPLDEVAWWLVGQEMKD